MRGVLVAAWSGLLLAGCSCTPDIADGQFMCGAAGECPEDFFCRSDGFCHSTPDGLGVDGGSRDGGDGADAGDGGGGDDAGDAGCSVRTDELDILLMIDNSNSMTEEQMSLTMAFPGFVAGLSGVDVRVAVVTSDLGARDAPVATCDMMGGDDGVLQNIRCGSTPPFISWTPGATTLAEFGTEFACLSAIGTGGCGFEQQLEASLKAITPGSSGIEFLSGSRNGHGDGVNAGFLRPDSVLVVLQLTDEDDCSLFDPDLYDPTNPAYMANLNIRCVQFPNALQPPSRYRDGFLALRPPDRLIYATIAGLPPGLTRGLTQQQVLDELEMMPVDDGMGNLIPSCDGGRGLAFAPRRLVTVGRDLEERGVRVIAESICQADLGPVLQALADAISDSLRGTCE